MEVKNASCQILQKGIFVFMNDRKKNFITIFVRGQQFPAILSARRVIAGGPPYFV